MRTTLTLDEDVHAKLEEEMRRQGKSFKEIVNHYLRLGLDTRRPSPRAKKFVVRARPMSLRRGFSSENIGDLLEQMEGPLHR